MGRGSEGRTKVDGRTKEQDRGWGFGVDSTARGTRPEGDKRDLKERLGTKRETGNKEKTMEQKDKLFLFVFELSPCIIHTVFFFLLKMK